MPCTAPDVPRSISPRIAGKVPSAAQRRNNVGSAASSPMRSTFAGMGLMVRAVAVDGMPGSPCVYELPVWMRDA
jgi:hypothetical protein